VPTLQLLHCLVSAEKKGGGTALTDGFYADIDSLKSALAVLETALECQMETK
jgi:hypothetical protein